MPQWHEKFSIAVMIVAMVTLPYLSYASVAEKLANAGFSLGSKIDKSVSFIVSFPAHAANTISNTIETGVSSAIDVARSIYQVAREETNRHHSMLRSPAMSGAGIHRMLGATQDAIQTTAGDALSVLQAGLSSLVSAPTFYLSSVKQGALALVSSLRGANEEAGETPLDVKEERSDGKTSNVKEPAIGEQLSSPLKIIERIIVKEVKKEPLATSELANSPPVANGYPLDPRINSLITNLADLTSRVDEKGGSQNSGLSLTSLYNMIAQSQRIKVLDDVKITNATIEGYATSKGVSDSLATYLPLGGGTLTGGLTGTSLSLSTTLSVTSSLNASSTAHFTATSTFGNLIRIEGTGTSTILGRLSISATSTMAGYKICTQQNNVCPSPWSSSGGLTTLSTATDLVGIGTSTPAEKLSINGGAFFDSDIIRYGSSSAPTLNFRYFASSTSTIPNLTSAFTFATSTTNTPLLTLSTKSSRYGRIGIGTSSPSALFAINALNSSNQADNIFYVGSSTQNAFVIDNHGSIGIGTSSPRSRLAIDGGLGAYFTSSGLFGLGTTTPWKSSTLSIEQNGVNPLFALGDTGTTSPFLMVTAKGIISFGSTSPVLVNPSDLVIGRNGVTNDAYISGGLGIGNATTTDGLLELSGIAYIGNVLKVKGTSTSTFAGPVELTATSTMAGYKVCTSENNCGPAVRTIRKTADQTVTSSAALQDDNQLFLAMAANETWYFTAYLLHIGNGTADIKFAFTIPAGATLSWGCPGARLNVSEGETTCSEITGSGTSQSWGSATANRTATIIGIVVNSTTAGNLQLQWAQDVATAVDTKVLTNSYLEAHK